MAVTSIKDLKINGEYHITLAKQGHVFKVRLLGVVQEFETTELHVNTINITKRTPIILNTIGIKTLGIGNTRDEARKNYSRLKHEPIESSYNTLESLEKEVEKIRFGPNKFQYFNFHGLDKSQYEIVNH